MNISMQLAVVLAAACLCLADGAPDGRLVRSKQQRPTRGFKNVEMMTARGFGKRDRPHNRAERDVEHQSSSERASRSKPTFKSPTVSIARDFGKRSSDGNEETYNIEAPTLKKKFKPKNRLMVAYDFGKRSGNEDLNEVLDADDFLEILGSAPEKETMENNDDKPSDSIPVELFVMEMLNHPEFARSVVSKFIDVNQDGMLSLEELLRNAA